MSKWGKSNNLINNNCLHILGNLFTSLSKLHEISIDLTEYIYIITI